MKRASILAAKAWRIAATFVTMTSVVAQLSAQTPVTIGVPISSDNPIAMGFMGGAVEIYARLGESDAAFDLIELLLSMPAGREMSVGLLLVDPNFDKLRSDPRFIALMHRFPKN